MLYCDDSIIGALSDLKSHDDIHEEFDAVIQLLYKLNFDDIETFQRIVGTIVILRKWYLKKQEFRKWVGSLKNPECKPFLDICLQTKTLPVRSSAKELRSPNAGVARFEAYLFAVPFNLLEMIIGYVTSAVDYDPTLIAAVGVCGIRLKTDIILYRGEPETYETSWDRARSSTLEIKTAEGFAKTNGIVYKIRIPAGTHLLPIWGFAVYHTVNHNFAIESEVILPPGSLTQVLREKKKDGITYKSVIFKEDTQKINESVEEYKKESARFARFGL